MSFRRNIKTITLNDAKMISKVVASCTPVRSMWFYIDLYSRENCYLIFTFVPVWSIEMVSHCSFNLQITGEIEFFFQWFWHLNFFFCEVSFYPLSIEEFVCFHIGVLESFKIMNTDILCITYVVTIFSQEQFYFHSLLSSLLNRSSWSLMMFNLLPFL
jgi:hypothetical protein